MMSEKELDELQEQLTGRHHNYRALCVHAAAALRQLRARVAELKKEERVWHRLDAALKVKI